MTTDEPVFNGLPSCLARTTTCALVLLCSLATVVMAEDEVRVAVEVLDPSSATFNSVNCEASLEGGILSIATGEQDALIDFGLSDSAIELLPASPLAIEIEMAISAEKELNESFVYWVPEGETKWKEYVRVPIRPDGEKHAYLLPLSTTKRIKALRITFGQTPQRLEIAGVRLTPIDRRTPAALAGEVESAPESITAAQDQLTASFDRNELRFTIDDEKTGRTWRSESLGPLVTVIGLEEVTADAFLVCLYDHFANRTLTAKVEVKAEQVVRFTLEADNYDAPLSAARFFPPRFSTDMSDGQIVFCDRSCGVLLDQQDTTYASWPLRVYGNTNCLDMPWVGLFDDKRGDGVMLLVETPADAEVAFVADEQGRHWPEARWLSSLDTHRYPRSVSLRFTDEGRYVELARCYREHLKAAGRFKTLAEKAAEKPAVERLRGAPALWGGRYPAKFIRQMRPLGVTRGVVNTCRDPGLIRWLNDQGYLTGRYDSYTDFVQGPLWFQSDDVAEAAIVPRPGGQPKHGWKKRSGEQMYWRSSAAWDRAEASYTPQELARRPYNARFIDVGAAAEPMEDFHPNHTFDRRQDLANRRALFDKMNGYGLVLGTEHGNDWVVDQVEYFEGTMSGPFWWSSWPAGYLDRPKLEQLSPQYLKYGMGYKHRVPLWELVFHDCANTTWYWGDTAGLLYEAAPELSDRKDLFNILYGTMPLFWMNGTGYRHPEETHRMLRSFHDTCQLHEVVGFEQMISHEFLTEDRELQRTRFSNGAVVVVNFGEEERAYSAVGRELRIAPRGFLIEAPGFLQSRLQTPYGPETVIKKDGYLTVASGGLQSVHGIRAAGRLTAFRVSKDRWNVFVDPDVECEINIREITGWALEDNLRIHYMDDLGELYRLVDRADSEGVVRFESKDNSWRYALARDSGVAENSGAVE